MNYFSLPMIQNNRISYYTDHFLLYQPILFAFQNSLQSLDFNHQMF